LLELLHTLRNQIIWNSCIAENQSVLRRATNIKLGQWQQFYPALPTPFCYLNIAHPIWQQCCDVHSGSRWAKGKEFAKFTLKVFQANFVAPLVDGTHSAQVAVEVALLNKIRQHCLIDNISLFVQQIFGSRKWPNQALRHDYITQAQRGEERLAECTNV